jgi:hypothetical protein
MWKIQNKVHTELYEGKTTIHSTYASIKSSLLQGPVQADGHSCGVVVLGLIENFLKASLTKAWDPAELAKLDADDLKMEDVIQESTTYRKRIHAVVQCIYNHGLRAAVSPTSGSADGKMLS